VASHSSNGTPQYYDSQIPRRVPSYSPYEEAPGLVSGYGYSPYEQTSIRRHATSFSSPYETSPYLRVAEPRQAEFYPAPAAPRYYRAAPYVDRSLKAICYP
jgi:hypothetical protein